MSGCAAPADGAVGAGAAGWNGDQKGVADAADAVGFHGAA